ncbi:MAG: hypothetical protein ACJ8CR_17635 [Roseiflexaceae bacterium]
MATCSGAGATPATWSWPTTDDRRPTTDGPAIVSCLLSPVS